MLRNTYRSHPPPLTLSAGVKGRGYYDTIAYKLGGLRDLKITGRVYIAQKNNRKDPCARRSPHSDNISDTANLPSWQSKDCRSGGCLYIRNLSIDYLLIFQVGKLGSDLVQAKRFLYLYGLGRLTFVLAMLVD